MKFEQVGPCGSLCAHGAGVFYEYKQNDSCLDITDTFHGDLLARLHFEPQDFADAKTYIWHLDRANKIRALSYSNNKTVNITETLDRRKVGAILKSTARNSFHAYNLHASDFTKFTSLFAEDNGLKCLKIKRFLSNDRLNTFYVGRIKTHSDNQISVRAGNIPKLMGALSDSLVRDLVTLEYGCKSSAGGLLMASFRLKNLSRILDEDFVPENILEIQGTTHSQNSC